MKRFTMKRLAIKRLAWILGTVLYSLVFAEIFIRIVAPQPMMPRNITASPWGVRGNIPGAHYRHTTAETDVAFQINAQGMRDARDFSPEKPAGTCRIELYGDSFFMGYELNMPDTIAARLEHKLKAEGYTVEVLNFAVSGFGTAESLQVLEKTGLSYKPDVVLFEWHSSDFQDNQRAGLYALRDGKLERQNETYLPLVDVMERLNRIPLYSLIVDNSQTYALLRERLSVGISRLSESLRGIGKPAAASPERRAGDLAAVAPDASIDISHALVRRAAERSREAGAAFALVDVPFRFKGGLRDTSTLLGLDASVPSLHPMDALLKADTSLRTVYFQRGMGHFTTKGAAIVSDMAANWILASKALSACHKP